MFTSQPRSINLPKEFAMARFVQPQFATSASQHIGSADIQRGAQRGFDGSKTLAGMLLAAVMAALLVVADQLIETWADGHLLVGWVALWTVAFAALALLAPPMRQLASAMATVIARWARAAKQRRMEETMWEYAQRDPRIMAELQSAITRGQREA